MNRLVICAFVILFSTNLYAGAKLTISATVDIVKQMMAQGKSKQEIAEWINAKVDQHVVALNRHTDDERNKFSDTQYEMNKATFDAWSDYGDEGGADYFFSAAHWVWENGYGHCQEHAHTVFHILMMAQQDGSNLAELTCGDHAYTVWGIPPGIGNEVSINDVNQWDGYIIDPWEGVVIPTKDLGRTNWYQTKGGTKTIEKLTSHPWKTYKPLYDKWLASCDELAGKYGLETDKLVVTEVLGQSNITVGQTQFIKPAGSFILEKLDGCKVKVTFKGSVVTGILTGTIANLFTVEAGNVTNIKLTRIRQGNQIKLKVTLIGISPNAGATIIREGILAKL